jgi:hypothetical protein
MLAVDVDAYDAVCYAVAARCTANRGPSGNDSQRLALAADRKSGAVAILEIIRNLALGIATNDQNVACAQPLERVNVDPHYAAGQSMR